MVDIKFDILVSMNITMFSALGAIKYYVRECISQLQG